MSSRNVGGRPKKLDIDLTPESLAGVLKNVWNEVEETKRIALQTFNKQQREVKDLSDIAMVSKINVDYLKVASDVSGKKIEVAKLIQTYIQKDAKADEGAAKTSAGVTTDDKRMIAEMIAAQRNKAAEPEEEYVPTEKEIQENEDEAIKKIMNGEEKERNSNVDITDADDDLGF